MTSNPGLAMKFLVSNLFRVRERDHWKRRVLQPGNQTFCLGDLMGKKGERSRAPMRNSAFAGIYLTPLASFASNRDHSFLASIAFPVDSRDCTLMLHVFA